MDTFDKIVGIIVILGLSVSVVILLYLVNFLFSGRIIY